MKLGTESKAKFKRLQRLLNMPLYQTVGVLEGLWQIAARDARRGDIGRLDNEEIAACLEWDRDADELINALIECRWIDVDDEYRLILHGWDEHAPNFIKGYVKQHTEGFLTATSKTGSKTGSKTTASPPTTKTRQDKTRQDKTNTCPAARNGSVSEDVETVVSHYRKHHPKSRPGDKERKLIGARLSEGYSAADLCQAIDGNHNSAWHRGENDSGRKYHKLELIVRNSDNVTQFMELAGGTGPRRSGLPTAEEKLRRQAQ